MVVERDDEADAAVLIEVAVRNGARKRRSRLSYILGLVVFSAIVGFIGWVLVVLAVQVGDNPTAACHCVLIVARIPMPIGWLGFLLKPLLFLVGGLALLLTLLWCVDLIRAVLGGDIDWGRKLGEVCPACGQVTLRESSVSHTEKAEYLRIRRKGTVTVCTNPDCDHATATGPKGKDTPISVDVKTVEPR